GFFVDRGHTMKTSFLSIAFFVCTATAVPAQQVTSIDILEYGLYTADTTARQQTESGVARNTIGNLTHAATTTTIPAQIGVRFGFEYRVNGAPADEGVELTKITVFPSPGL